MSTQVRSWSVDQVAGVLTVTRTGPQRVLVTKYSVLPSASCYPPPPPPDGDGDGCWRGAGAGARRLVVG